MHFHHTELDQTHEIARGRCEVEREKESKGHLRGWFRAEVIGGKNMTEV